jgi:hypothetical protein
MKGLLAKRKTHSQGKKTLLVDRKALPVRKERL